MKNKALFSILVAGAFVFGGATVIAYEEYREQQAVESRRIEAEQDDKRQAIAEAEAKRVAAVEAEKKRLAYLCQSLRTTYSKLTPYQKTITEEPICDLEQVE